MTAPTTPIATTITKGDDDFAADAKNWRSRFNITRVSPHLFIGGAITSSKMLKGLLKYGVTDIMCVAAEECDRDYDLVNDLGRKKRPDLFCVYMSDQVAAAPVVPVPPEDFLALYRHWRNDMARTIFDDDPLPVWYVHCHSGMHRAPIATAFLLAATTGMPLEVWLSHLSAIRPEIAPDEAPLLVASARRALALLGGGAPDGAGDGARGDSTRAVQGGGETWGDAWLRARRGTQVDPQ